MTYICDHIEIMRKDSPMVCLKGFDMEAFKERFAFSMNDDEVKPKFLIFREMFLLMALSMRVSIRIELCFMTASRSSQMGFRAKRVKVQAN